MTLAQHLTQLTTDQRRHEIRRGAHHCHHVHARTVDRPTADGARVVRTTACQCCGRVLRRSVFPSIYPS